MAASEVSELDENEYTPEEDERLTRNLAAVLGEILNGRYLGERHSPSLLFALHHSLFTGVRDHAGTARSERWGSEYLNFGPNRSSHRRDVSRELDTVFEQLRISVRSLEENRDAIDFEEKALHIAVWAHARVVQVHPFQDGNGRSSRLLLALLLRRFELPDLPVEACKQEYNGALNHFFANRDVSPLVDLFLALVPSVLNGTAT